MCPSQCRVDCLFLPALKEGAFSVLFTMDKKVHLRFVNKGKGLFFLVTFLMLLLSQGTTAQVSYRHFLLAGQMELSRENYVAAINNFNTAIQSNAEGFEAWFLRGIAKYSLGDYQGAASDFSYTIAMHPLYTRAYLYRGICSDQMHNYQAALADFDHALTLDPFDVEVLAARGEAKIHFHDYAGAVKDYSAALQLKPNNPLYLLNRGVANHLARNDTAALADLRKSIQLDSYNPEVFIKRGMIYYELDSLQQSLKDYHKAVSMDSTYPFTYFQRALTYLKMKDTTAVLRDYSHVLALDTTNALTYYNRALVEASQKDYQAALSDFNNVIALNPNNIYAWFNRGILHLEHKKYADAETDFSKSITLFPDFVGGYINRSIVRNRLGNQKGAFSDRKKAAFLIAMANKGTKDAGMLYRRYADSIYFRKIIRFQGDFLSGEMKRGRVQFSRIQIAPKPDMQVMIYNEQEAEDKKDAPVYFDEKIVRYNADNEMGIRLGFSTGIQGKSSRIKELEAKDKKILQSGDTAGYFFIQGIMYYAAHHNLRSIHAYDSTLLYNSQFVYALLNRGATQLEQDNYLWSEQQYKSTVGIHKTGFTSNAQSLIRPPDHKLSLTDYNRLIRLYPSLPYVYYNRANLKTDIRKFQRAIDDYSMAIKLEPGMAEAYFNRALVLLYLKENKLACKDLSKAGELGISEAYNIIKRYCGKE